MKHALLIAEFLSTPWALLPERLAAITGVIHRWVDGVRFSESEIQAVVGNAPQATAERRAADAARPAAVAVLPLFGVVSHRIHQVQNISGPGGTSTEGFSRRFRQALEDPAVGAIVIDVDSPGGSVYGVAELAAQIYEARGKKKVVAVANSLAASAAYWIAAAAEELVITPAGEVGSIGVYTAHEDWSKALELKGIKPSLISAGKYKTEGNPYEPLADEARAAIQKRVDEYYDMFTKAVAKYRGATPSDVREGYGQGRVVGAKEALALNMADRIETLDDTLARLASSKRAQSPRRAAAETALQEVL
jgi:signal peptide peptidase SppA